MSERVLAPLHIGVSGLPSLSFCSTSYLAQVSLWGTGRQREQPWSCEEAALLVALTQPCHHSSDSGHDNDLWGLEWSPELPSWSVAASCCGREAPGKGQRGRWLAEPLAVLTPQEESYSSTVRKSQDG